ncbi:double-stranded RNA-specific editase B2 [Engraulis encrasicolus]|uniref:double-stranded RNA-specific editase B2 n=1 Tax=Engraulis encrasicolus TaxID=184585 RepID=UPI002FCFFCCF
MASVLGNNTRASGTPNTQVKCKFKRRRRRRSKRKERVGSTLSALIVPFKYMSPGTASTEDEDNLSTSSAEVKENRNVGNLEDRVIGSSERQSSLFPTERRPSRGGASGLKRKRPLEEENHCVGRLCRPRPVYPRRPTCSWSDAPKNALVQLNELRPGLQYRLVSQTGPVHAPLFAIAVEVNGLSFEGTGPTKKKAKMRAAELALHSFVQFPNTPQAHNAMGAHGCPPTDFTSDQTPDSPDPLFRGFEPAAVHGVSTSEGLSLCRSVAESELLISEALQRRAGAGRLLWHTLDLMVQARQRFGPYTSSTTTNTTTTTTTTSDPQKSPVALLGELRPGLRYSCLLERTDPPIGGSFVMALRVDGRVFEGSGRSKKLAKNQAARCALQALFNIRLAPDGRGRAAAAAVAAAGRAGVGAGAGAGIQPSRNKCPHLPQDFADAIFHLVREKYRELAGVSTSPLHARHKGLAGIVMTRGLDLRQAQVVALSTGTKCINGEYMSDQGLVVNDCHAEIITRRAFISFLYSQLELYDSHRKEDWESSIFVRHKQAGFRLRADVFFHMYISTSPCGDARINSPYESSSSHLPGGRPLVKRLHTHLRTKIEAGEGTLPVRSRAPVQTWDGVLQGERLITMSCTDKITRWNVLGLQGALLSRLVEPLYLHSLTVGSLRHTGHFSRVLSQRLERLGALPAPYRRNQPLLSGVSSSECRPAGKSPCVSVNWSAGDVHLEVLNASTGKRKDSGAPSRLCKHALFTRWARLCRRLNVRTASALPRGHDGGESQSEVLYGEAKRAAARYQTVKQRWFRSLQETGLGTWVRKPPEQDQFLPGV